MSILRKYYWVLILSLMLFLSLVVLVFIPPHLFIWIAAIWFIGFTIFFLKTRTQILRLANLYAASLVFAFALAETYAASRMEGHWRGEYTGTGEASNLRHPQLGLSSVAGTRLRFKGFRDEQLIIDYTFSINEHGWRTQPEPPQEQRHATLFFGCSFTFGYGVDDHETSAYLFQEFTGRPTLNLGFHDYGPHQMLTILENQMEAPPLNDLKPERAIYQAIPDHIYRSAGTNLESFGPRYRLNSDGSLSYQGQYLLGRFSTPVLIRLLKSHALRYLFFRWYPAPEWTPAEVELYVAIVKESKRIFHERYDSEFIVLLWPDPDTALYDQMLTRMREAGLRVYEVSELLHKFESERESYYIPQDSHPSARGHRELAEQLANLVTTR